MISNFARTKGARDRKKRKKKIWKGALKGAAIGAGIIGGSALLNRAVSKMDPSKLQGAKREALEAAQASLHGAGQDAFENATNVGKALKGGAILGGVTGAGITGTQKILDARKEKKKRRYFKNSELVSFARTKGAKDKKKRKKPGYGGAALVAGGAVGTSILGDKLKRAGGLLSGALSDEGLKKEAASLRTLIKAGMPIKEAQVVAGKIGKPFYDKAKSAAKVGKIAGRVGKTALIGGGLLSAGLAAKTFHDRLKAKRRKIGGLTFERKEKRFSNKELVEFARTKGAKDKKKRKKPTLEGHVRKGAGIGSKIGGALGALHGGAKGALVGSLGGPVGAVAGGLGGAAASGGLGYVGGAATGAGYGAGIYGLRKNRIEKLKKKSKSK